MCSRADRCAGQAHVVPRGKDGPSRCGQSSPTPELRGSPLSPVAHLPLRSREASTGKPATLTAPGAAQAPLIVRLAAGRWPRLHLPSLNPEFTFREAAQRKARAAETAHSPGSLRCLLGLLAGSKHHSGHRSTCGMGQAGLTRWIPASPSCLLAVPKSPVPRPLPPRAGPHDISFKMCLCQVTPIRTSPGAEQDAALCLKILVPEGGWQQECSPVGTCA